MDFEYTEEQRLLRESLDRLLGDSYGFDKRKAYLAETEGFSPTMWAQYAELGLLGLPFAEAHGGFGGGGVETMVVMEALGRVIALGAVKLDHLGADSRRIQQLPTSDAEDFDDLGRAVVRFLVGHFAHGSCDGVLAFLRLHSVQGLHHLTERFPDFVRELVLGE